jgi:hypothetical protein
MMEAEHWSKQLGHMVQSGDYDFVWGQEIPENEIDAFENEFGIRLPEEYRDTLLAMSGWFLRVRSQLWPPVEDGQLRPVWTFHSGLVLFGLGHGFADHDLRAQARAFAKQNPKCDKIPFLALQNCWDRWCFDREGRIHHWEYDTRTFRQEDLTFNDLMARELRQLAERKSEITRRPPEITTFRRRSTIGAWFAMVFIVLPQALFMWIGDRFRPV